MSVSNINGTDLLDDRKLISRDFKDLIKQPNFRRFCWWLLEQTAPLAPNYDIDPHKHAYMTGKSDLGKQVMGLLLTDHPEKYKQMIDERKSILKLREDTNKDDD